MSYGNYAVVDVHPSDVGALSAPTFGDVPPMLASGHDRGDPTIDPHGNPYFGDDARRDPFENYGFDGIKPNGSPFKADVDAPLTPAIAGADGFGDTVQANLGDFLDGVSQDINGIPYQVGAAALAGIAWAGNTLYSAVSEDKPEAGASIWDTGEETDVAIGPEESEECSTGNPQDRWVERVEQYAAVLAGVYDIDVADLGSLNPCAVEHAREAQQAQGAMMG